MGQLRPFTGGINAFGSSYYIHYHQENIGYANGATKAPNIVGIFTAQRQQAAQAGVEAYRQLLLPNISSDSQELLNELFANEDAMSEFDKQIKEQIQENLSNDNRVQELMSLQRQLFNPKSSFINSFQNAGAQIKSFDELLETLAKAADLLETKEGAALAGILRGATSGASRAPSIKIMGLKLQKALDTFIKQNNGNVFSQNQAKKAAEEINKLASVMVSKTTKSGTSYSKGAIQHLVDNIFNVGFAEGLVAVATKIGNKAINDSFLELTGSKTHNLFVFEPGQG